MLGEPETEWGWEGWLQEVEPWGQSLTYRGHGRGWGTAVQV